MEKKFSYDEIGYPKKLFMQTHPEHLATLAAVFGMKPPALDGCRVLELGCGTGYSLLAHAFDLPGAHFVGVDLAGDHIREAKNSAEELKLSNIEFHRMDVMDIKREDFGEFDYITAHGLFSWVPEQVREKILALYDELLAPAGVGYISFNAFPGARQRQMAGEIMRFFSRRIDDPLEKVERSVAFLDFLAENAGEAEIYQAALKKELERFRRLEASEIFHDDLSEVNRPFYFYEFAERLAERDLQFLAEADLEAMFPHDLGAEAADFINSLDDIIEREQFIDFFRGHTFRRVLVCRRGIELNRRLEPAVLKNFLFNSGARPVSANFDPGRAGFEEFVGPGGVSVSIDHPLTKAALFYLGRIWGRSAPLSEILERGREILTARGFQSADWPAEFQTAGGIFLELCTNTNLIRLHQRQTRAADAPGEKPALSDFARWQLQKGSEDLLSLYNISISFEDPFMKKLLFLLDGTRTRSALLDEMRSFAGTAEGGNGQDLSDRLPGLIDAALEQLARLGMLKR